jgi:hypothetical protein
MWDGFIWLGIGTNGGHVSKRDLEKGWTFCYELSDCQFLKDSDPCNIFQNKSIRCIRTHTTTRSYFMPINQLVL